MRLKKLYIHGFKSFADKVEINFEQGVTGVVGPNGCGKSNIGDAVRWVLGEQSAKQLRGSRMEDVIFNGTDKRRRAGYCEVMLVFDNEDHALPIDFTEVSVTRRVYRTGDSEYLINNSACRLKDVIDLFRDTGTGRDGYSIIGQGRVDEILSQKTEERRQVFEEAAGIVKYRARKQEAERRLDNTQTNLDRLNDIVESLEERIEPLREQSEDARKFLALRDELKGLELNAFLIRSERYNTRIAETKEALEQIGEEVSANTAKQIELTEERDAHQEALTQGETEAAALRDELQEYIRQVEAGEGTAGVLRERMDAQKRELKRIEDEKTAAEQGESGLTARIEELEKELVQKKEALVSMQENTARTEEELAKAEQELAELTDRAEQAKEDVISAMNALGDVRSEQARLTALSQAIDVQIINLTASRNRAAENTDTVERAFSDATDQMAEEQKRLDVLKADAIAVTEETRKAGEEYDTLSAKRNTILAKRQELSARAKLLNELQRDYDGYNLSVKQVLREAERLGGAGVHGVVANIIHADQKIEKAVETALGAALQDIIVDTEEDAREMIEFLKQNRYGRATFLPISAVRGRTLEGNERRVLSMNGCVGVASEMVTFDEKYRGIVENLLGRTVIADDLTAGIPIHRAGRQMFRLVTLDGSIMNVGGSMTGGSTQSRMTSLLSREREIKETGEQLGALNAQLNEADARMRVLSEGRAALKGKRQEAFEEVHQQEIALTRAEAHLNKAKDDRDALMGRIGGIEKEIENLTAQKEQMEKEVNDLLTRKTENENNSGALREKAAKLSSDLNALRPVMDNKRRQAADERVATTTAEKDVEIREGELRRLISQKGDTARILAEAEENMSALREQMVTGGEELRVCEAELGRQRLLLNTTRDKFNEVDGARLKTQGELKTLNETLETLMHESDELNERVHRCEMLMQRLQSDLDTMTGRIWEDYQLTYEGAEEFRSEEFKLSEGEKRIAVIKSDIRALGPVNVSAMDEYREVSARYEELSGQKADLEKAKEDILSIINDLAGKMEKVFKAQLETLDVYFRQTFSELFGGGVAHLSLEDPEHPLTSGIEIVAQPPGKKLQLLSLLSGGERALTAIAILFAMLKLKPTPFCILDEIEAALDDANIDNFAEYLKTYSEKTQFVVVTHRKGTMARCDALYGVAMEEKGVSKLMSVKLADAV